MDVLRELCMDDEFVAFADIVSHESPPGRTAFVFCPLDTRAPENVMTTLETMQTDAPRTWVKWDGRPFIVIAVPYTALRALCFDVSGPEHWKFDQDGEALPQPENAAADHYAACVVGDEQLAVGKFALAHMPAIINSKKGGIA